MDRGREKHEAVLLPGRLDFAFLIQRPQSPSRYIKVDDSDWGVRLWTPALHHEQWIYGHGASTLQAHGSSLHHSGAEPRASFVVAAKMTHCTSLWENATCTASWMES